MLKAVTRNFASPPLVLAMYSVCVHSLVKDVHSLAREKVFLYMNISKSPKDTKTTTFSQEFNNFTKTELQTIFLKLEYAGQNKNSGLHPKKFGVIFF